MTYPPSGIIAYLDASALVKRYVVEAGSSWVATLCDPSAANTIATARITKVEAAAAFASKRRSGDLPKASYLKVLQDLAYDFMHQYLLVEVDTALVDLAVELTKRHKLRGYDAVQLASALTLDRLLSQARADRVVFIAADKALLEAAQEEGMNTDNPDRYS